MDLSTRLSYLFGTEKYVGIRRQLVLLREKMDNHLHVMKKEDVYNICSGSLGEGVAYPKSDDDVMICYTNMRVVTKYREATQRGDVLLVPSEYSPGYCLLLDANGLRQDNVIHNIYEIPFLSSSAFKLFHLNEIEQQFQIHGPCLSGSVGLAEFDHAFCIPCSTWPDVAKDWLTRNRSYNWISCDMIQNIVSNGCHVVPVGYPDSPHCDHEWRISFSVAERTLMHLFNHTQFLVYNLLRLTLKRIIEKSFNDVLCSYFMKTTLFYTAEKIPIKLWRECNLEICLKACLGVLYDFVDQKYCCNYFIPDYNMIRRKINHTNRRGMLDMIRTIHNIGILGILTLSGESRCLDATLMATDMEYKLDREFMNSAHLFKVFISIEGVFRSLPHEVVVSYTDCLSNFVRMVSEGTQNELIKMMWSRCINSYCLRIMHCLFILPKNNKHKYSVCQNLIPLLRLGCRGDVTTGKLTMATYMYMVGKTESALYAIQGLLSEYPPYAIDDSRDEMKRRAYIDVMCGRGYSVDYKTMRSYVPGYSLNSPCLKAFPYALKIFISIRKSSCINPLTYTYFLQSLCYVQLRNQVLLKISTRSLVKHMFELISDKDMADAGICVGIIKYVQGDTQSAFRWLGSAYVMANRCLPPFTEELSHSVLTYAACLLHTKFCFEKLHD